MRGQNVIWIALCIFVSVSFAENKISHSFVDKRVGGIVVGKERIEEVIRLYGHGFSQKNFHGETLCYYDVLEQIYLNIAFHDGIVESVILSKTLDQKIAKKCKEHIIKNKILVTGKGIRLGDSPKKIIEIYSEPQKKEVKDGLLIFEYHADSENDPEVNLAYDAYLYFKNDALIRLVIHDGE